VKMLVDLATTASDKLVRDKARTIFARVCELGANPHKLIPAVWQVQAKVRDTDRTVEIWHKGLSTKFGDLTVAFVRDCRPIATTQSFFDPDHKLIGLKVLPSVADESDCLSPTNNVALSEGDHILATLKKRLAVFERFFIHEYVHYADVVRHHRPQPTTYHDDDYHNNAVEYNAHYQEYVGAFDRKFATLNPTTRKLLLHQNFADFVRALGATTLPHTRTQGQFGNFLAELKSPWRRKLLRRLFGWYKELQK